MALPLLNELQERLHACAIAGLNVIGEDFRLARALEQLAQAQASSPVLARIYQTAAPLADSQEEVRDLGQRLRTGIESIHNFGQRSCTLFVETHMAYPQDQSDFYEDIITALLGRSRRK